MARRQLIVVVLSLILVSSAACSPGGEVPQAPPRRADAAAKDLIPSSSGGADGASDAPAVIDRGVRPDASAARDDAAAADAGAPADSKTGAAETMTTTDAAMADAVPTVTKLPGYKDAATPEDERAPSTADAGGAEAAKVTDAGDAAADAGSVSDAGNFAVDAGDFADGGDVVDSTDATTAAPSPDGAATLDAGAPPPLDAGGAESSCDRGVVLSQLYGGGGNTSALYSHDFVELHNRGRQPVDLTGWSIQYASPTGASWTATPLPAVVVPGGGYLLIQEGSGGAVGVALPGPDASGTINLGGASGKVALVAGVAVLSGACPQGAPIVDFIGYGAATCFEGSAAAGSPPAGDALVRQNGGCSDTDQNAIDLGSAPASPRNAAAPASICDCCDCAAAPAPQAGAGQIGSGLKVASLSPASTWRRNRYNVRFGVASCRLVGLKSRARDFSHFQT